MNSPLIEIFRLRSCDCSRRCLASPSREYTRVYIVRPSSAKRRRMDRSFRRRKTAIYPPENRSNSHRTRGRQTLEERTGTGAGRSGLHGDIGLLQIIIDVTRLLHESTTCTRYDCYKNAKTDRSIEKSMCRYSKGQYNTYIIYIKYMVKNSTTPPLHVFRGAAICSTNEPGWFLP